MFGECCSSLCVIPETLPNGDNGFPEGRYDDFRSFQQLAGIPVICESEL